MMFLLRGGNPVGKVRRECLWRYIRALSWGEKEVMLPVIKEVRVMTSSNHVANPSVSIIVATSNRPELALRAVMSVVNQTLVDKEIIVVNNGSSDANLQRYHALFSSLAGVVCCLDICVALGPSRARNLGIAKAKGRYITFCDDDDEWCDPTYLERVNEALIHHQPDIVFADQQAVTADGVLKKTHWFDRERLLAAAVPLTEGACYAVHRDYFYRSGGFPHLNITLYSRELIDCGGAFCRDLTYEEDFELFHRLSARARLVIYFDQVVSRHHIPDSRHHDNLTTSLSETDKQLSRLTIFNKLSVESTQPELSRFAVKQGSYAVSRLAEEALSNRHYRLAATLAKQALGWRLTPAMGRLFLYAVFRQWINKVMK